MNIDRGFIEALVRVRRRQLPSRAWEAPHHVKCVRELESMVTPLGAFTALDAAAGESPSLIAKLLRGLGMKVVTLDACAQADVRADLHFLPFPDRLFDLVAARHCLEHMLIPTIALQELCRVSRRWLLMILPCDSHKFRTWPDHLNCFDKSAWEGMFREAGLSIQYFEEGDFTEFFREPRTDLEWRWLLQKEED